MKRPSFQFYPGDWLNDAGLRMCSVGARGLWADMMCLMHQGTPYGYMKVNLATILPANLARMTGATLSEVEGWIGELESSGVFSRDADGSIFSRRMIRDEEIRSKRAAGGVLGGNPALLGNKTGESAAPKKVNLAPNLRPTPSSSSSSSNKTPPTPQGVRFQDFWQAWPSSERKSARSACEKKWKTRKLDEVAENILAHIEAMKGTDTWQRGFEPSPMTYINQSRWEDGVDPTKSENQGGMFV